MEKELLSILVKVLKWAQKLVYSIPITFDLPLSPLLKIFKSPRSMVISWRVKPDLYFFEEALHFLLRVLPTDQPNKVMLALWLKSAGILYLNILESLHMTKWIPVKIS